jgi:hypothetical protein
MREGGIMSDLDCSAGPELGVGQPSPDVFGVVMLTRQGLFAASRWSALLIS